MKEIKEMKQLRSMGFMRLLEPGTYTLSTCVTNSGILYITSLKHKRFYMVNLNNLPLRLIVNEIADIRDYYFDFAKNVLSKSMENKESLYKPSFYESHIRYNLTDVRTGRVYTVNSFVHNSTKKRLWIVTYDNTLGKTVTREYKTTMSFLVFAANVLNLTYKGSV